MKKKTHGQPVLPALALTAVLTSALAGAAPAGAADLSSILSDFTNPIVQKRDENGDIVFGGDPAVLVDGDTVYLYTGHDASTDAEVASATYNIPEYLCYSSQDLITWKSEGVVMEMKDVSWANGSTSAWAAQTVKHTDPSTGKDMYYLYFCSWDRTARGKQSIGVAVSESPTGPFTDIGQSLVPGYLTKPETSAWNDIDPTVWVDTDENGTEHRYLAWGNGIFYCCELGEDMISILDINGDGEITCGPAAQGHDIVSSLKGLTSYTEAPWLYKRSSGNGEDAGAGAGSGDGGSGESSSEDVSGDDSAGEYYLFYAWGWREGMGYARTSDPMSGEWTGATQFMAPTPTSNTNHEAVFDFNGKTYMIYHNGALPGGSGYRRSACIMEITFDEDGNVTAPGLEGNFIDDTVTGPFGTACTLTVSGGARLSHEHFICSVADADYPYSAVKVGAGLSEYEADARFVFTQGKADVTDGVSVQADNKAGLYLTATDEGTAVLAQDTEATDESALRQTWIVRIEESEGGEADTADGALQARLESAAQAGLFVTVGADGLTLDESGTVLQITPEV